MAAPYTYVKIRGAYYCLQQNPLVLMWFLYVKNKSLCLGSLDLDRRKAASVVRSFVRFWLGFRRGEPILPLPVYGNLCLPVHRGYRVFDLGRRTATKVFGPEADEDQVADEIESVRKSSLLEFAPTVRRWSIEERLYEEDFVIGCLGHSVSGTESPTVIERYRRDVEPCIERLILLQAPLSVNLGEYLDETIDSVRGHGLGRHELDGGKADSIGQFIEASANRLRPKADQQIELVFSHGDFSLVNILSTEKGIMVVDWESAGRRSVLFDLYNYFLTEMYYDRATVNLFCVVNEAISSLQSRLAARGLDTAGDLPSLAQTYRKLYYLERIHMLLEREPTNNQLDVILRSIDVFNRYEEAVVSA